MADFWYPELTGSYAGKTAQPAAANRLEIVFMDYFHLSAGQDTLDQISSLGLAHLGDAVYELMVRSWLCLHG